MWPTTPLQARGKELSSDRRGPNQARSCSHASATRVVRAPRHHTASPFACRANTQPILPAAVVAAAAAAAAGAGAGAEAHDEQLQHPLSSGLLWSDDVDDVLGGDAVDTWAQPATEPPQLQLGNSAAATQRHPEHEATPVTLIQHHRHSHQRRYSQQAALSTVHVQESAQHDGLQRLQPVVRSVESVHLLQRVARVHSWSAAAFLLQQASAQMSSPHVGLLWSQLTHLLQADKAKTGNRNSTRSWTLVPHQQQQDQEQQHHVHLSSGSHQPQWLHQGVIRGSSQQQQQQQPAPDALQRQVLQQLCSLTAAWAASMTPEALSTTLQGLAAAAAAHKLVLAPAAATAASGQAASSSTGAGAAVGAAAAAAQAGDRTAAATGGSTKGLGVVLDAEVCRLLYECVMRVAGSFTPQQLAHCLESGRWLGWQLYDSSSSSGSSSSSSAALGTEGMSQGSSVSPVVPQCCGVVSVLEVAVRGQLGDIMARGQLTCWEAAHLLHALAAYADSRGHMWQQQQRQQQQQEVDGFQQAEEQQQHLFGLRGGRGLLLDQLAAQACAVLQAAAAPEALRRSAHPKLGEGVTFTYSYTQHQHQPQQQQQQQQQLGTAAAAATTGGGGGVAGRGVQRSISVLKRSLTATSSSTQSEGLGSRLAAAVCSVQALAALEVMPEAIHLEQLLSALEPHVASGRLSVHQLLQLLSALLDLQVEPWPEWLAVSYSHISSQVQLLQPEQLLLLLAVLPRVTNLQPPQQLLQVLAKMTAVHSSRYSWQQLAELPLLFRALGYRPERYWIKDYLAATSTLCRVQQQQQQQWQHQGHSRRRQQQQLDVCPEVGAVVGVLSGVAWLSTTTPPADWLTDMEQVLLLAAAQQQQHQQQQQQQQQLAGMSVGAAEAQGCLACCQPADTAAVVQSVFTQWQHVPGPGLQQLLVDTGMLPGQDGGGSSSASTSTSSSGPLQQRQQHGSVSAARKLSSSSSITSSSSVSMRSNSSIVSSTGMLLSSSSRAISGSRAVSTRKRSTSKHKVWRARYTAAATKNGREQSSSSSSGDLLGWEDISADDFDADYDEWSTGQHVSVDTADGHLEAQHDMILDQQRQQQQEHVERLFVHHGLVPAASEVKLQRMKGLLSFRQRSGREGALLAA